MTLEWTDIALRLGAPAAAGIVLGINRDLNNKPIGVGEAVKVGENFGLRITQIGDIKQIIQSLGSENR